MSAGDSKSLPEPEFQYDVFLCHNSKDKDQIRRANEQLRQHLGIRTFLDESVLVGGEQWDERIKRALAGSRTCAIMLGASGWGTYQLEHEAKPALSRQETDPGFRVVPVMLPGMDPKDLLQLEAFFKETHWVDLREGREDRIAILRLASRCT